MEFLGIGLPELLVILVLALIVVGPNRLPEVAANLARFVRAARRYGNQVFELVSYGSDGVEFPS